MHDYPLTMSQKKDSELHNWSIDTGKTELRNFVKEHIYIQVVSMDVVLDGFVNTVCDEGHKSLRVSKTIDISLDTVWEWYGWEKEWKVGWFQRRKQG